MIVQGPLAHAAVSSGQTRVRQTEPSGTARFGEVLRAGGQVLLAGVQAAVGTILPGGETLVAAVRDGVATATHASTASASTGQRPDAPGSAATTSVGSGSSNEGSSDLWAMTQQSQEFNLMYLQLQEELSRENRRFSALSNVLKSRHDTAQAVIANI
jgi:hypothetical protein